MHDEVLQNYSGMNEGCEATILSVDDSKKQKDEKELTAVKRRKYGWKKDLPDKRDLKHKFKKPGVHFGSFYLPYRVTLPSKIDLRANCPDVYDQGNLGSCTANALAAAYEFDEIKQASDNKPEIFSPSRLFIYFNERQLENTVDTDSGASLRDGIKTINKIGVCHDSLWPYIVSKYTIKPTKRCYEDAKLHKTVEYKSLDQDLDNFKSCLKAGFPFVFGFMVYESFESDDVAKTGKMIMPDLEKEKAVGGHAVLAVGYDDSINSFIIRNSWGTSWGDKGYFYMPYDYIVDEDLAGDFWTVTKI